MVASAIRTEVRRGAYVDSLVLMQLERELAARPGVAAAGVVMGTAANRPLLAAAGLLTPEAEAAAPDDLVAVVRAESAEAAAAALAELDVLLTRRVAAAQGDYRPRTLAAAARLLPEAGWVVVSVPGRWAAGVAREALALPPHGRHVFLYSDNVPLAEEVALKREAARRGLLLMGPDCGTAIVAGTGLGFANRVRRGSIGLVGASGTGLQAVTTRIHALGAGVSHALGTGGRDLSEEVGGATARRALDLLARDPATRVIVLVSKPPAPRVAAELLAVCRATGKPVVVDFLGHRPAERRDGNLHFAARLGEAAELAVALAGGGETTGAEPAPLAGSADPTAAGRSGAEAATAATSVGDAAASVPIPPATLGPGTGRSYLRALFGGGTLATEAVLALRPVLAPLASNLHLPGVVPLADPATSAGHTVVDLGADELTVGRPHPMIDPRAAAERLRREAADPETALILLDVVLGDGTHPDPAVELAPAIAAARAGGDDGAPEVVAVVVGTEDDPQDLGTQRERLAAAGARVFDDLDTALAWVVERLSSSATGAPVPPADAPDGLGPTVEGEGEGHEEVKSVPIATTSGSSSEPATYAESRQSGEPATGIAPRAAAAPASAVPVPLTALAGPLAAINVGLATFHDALAAQGARVVQVDWRPPAGGDERLAAILAKMKGTAR